MLTTAEKIGHDDQLKTVFKKINKLNFIFFLRGFKLNNRTALHTFRFLLLHLLRLF